MSEPKRREWTRIEDLSAEDFERAKESGQAKKSFVLPRTVGFGAKWLKYPFGSGTFFHHKGSYMIATASHVITDFKDFDFKKVEILFHTGDGEKAVAKPLADLSPKIAFTDWQNGEPDVGVVGITLNAAALESIKGAEPVAIGSIKRLEMPDDGREAVVLCGYPGALGKQENRTTMIVHSGFVKRCGSVEHKDAGDKGYGRSADADHHVDWSHGAWIEQGAAPVTAEPTIDPRGASGGGLWYMRPKPGETGTAIAEFVGIPWLWAAPLKCVRAIPAMEWLDFAKTKGFVKDS